MFPRPISFFSAIVVTLFSLTKHGCIKQPCTPESNIASMDLEWFTPCSVIGM
jgi:hypothetical protein